VTGIRFTCITWGLARASYHLIPLLFFFLSTTRRRLISCVNKTGIEEKIIEGYSFICHNYSPDQGDEIILIGFSRGGFIVRCIADLVYRVGVLTKFGLYYIRDAYDSWREAGEKSDKEMTTVFGVPPPINKPDDDVALSEFEMDLGDTDEEDDEDDDDDDDNKCRPEGFEKRLTKKELQEEIRRGNTKIVNRGVPVEVCAAWDTVGALGPLTMRLVVFPLQPFFKLGFIRSELNPGICNAFQALSLHDRRRCFMPIVWSRPKGAEGEKIRLEQCWFMGTHGEVGGGLRGDGLAQFSLAWMLGKLDSFVDMDLGNFWSPRPDMTKWYTAEDHHLRLHYQNPFPLSYWLAGAKYRKPRCQFWGIRGLEELKPHEVASDKNNISGEFMHFSVQMLAEDEAMPRCKSLRTVPVPPRSYSEEARVVWELPFRKPGLFRLPRGAIRACYDVYEAAPEPTNKGGRQEMELELKLLIKWYGSESEQMGLDSSPEKSEPDHAMGHAIFRLQKLLRTLVSW